MGKIDIEFRSKRSQRTVSCIEQGVCGAIIRRSEPFALEDSPERLAGTCFQSFDSFGLEAFHPGID